MRHSLAFASLALVLFAAGARAESQVTSTGSAIITRVPDTVRMTYELTSEGKDMAEALTALAVQREAFKQRLDAAAPAHSEFAEPRLAVEDEARRQMLMMRNGSPQPADTTVRLAQTVKAEWPLAGATPEDRLRAAAAIRQKLQPAPTLFSSQPSTAPTTQSELLEESGANPNTPGATPAIPTLTYVAIIPQADRRSAIAGAFNDAKAGAAQIADAIGTTLGSPIDIKVTITPTRDANADAQAAYWEVILAAAQKPLPATNAGTEAVGPQPSSVSLTVTVNASFTLGAH